ncbi:MAG: hypothetical protein II833_07385 [Pseudobutyrivibrio sp.]|nr:hypothetical protein [Pseudobutyrivibrio sp.]
MTEYAAACEEMVVENTTVEITVAQIALFFKILLIDVSNIIQLPFTIFKPNIILPKKNYKKNKKVVDK